VIDAGATALSKDKGPTHIEPNVGYGKIVQDYPEGLLDTRVIITSLSQEHGKLILPEMMEVGIQHGDRVRIIPNHSCLTANLFDYYHVVRGHSVVDRWRVHRGRFE
jgi:D-serine deaminase-like pyridoxal phosphate-dependent protein